MMRMIGGDAAWAEKRNRCKWSAYEDDYIVNMFARGCKERVIAKNLRRSEKAVMKRMWYLSRTGRIPSRHRPWTKADDAKILEKHSELTYEQMASLLGRNMAVVKNHCCQLKCYCKPKRESAPVMSYEKLVTLREMLNAGATDKEAASAIGYSGGSLSGIKKRYFDFVIKSRYEK